MCVVSEMKAVRKQEVNVGMWNFFLFAFDRITRIPPQLSGALALRLSVGGLTEGSSLRLALGAVRSYRAQQSQRASCISRLSAASVFTTNGKHGSWKRRRLNRFKHGESLRSTQADVTVWPVQVEIDAVGLRSYVFSILHELL